MVHNLLLALTNRYSGRSCRRCGDGIVQRDSFGVSEGVCPACRA